MYNNKIRFYREKKGITLQELSYKTGLSAGYLCHLEKGTRSNPSAITMDLISMVLNKKVSEIFFD